MNRTEGIRVDPAGGILVEKRYEDANRMRKATSYFHKHSGSLSRRLSNWREQKIAGYSLELANHPKSILDIPCGAGRFWELLAQKKERIIYAADLSGEMLQVACMMRPKEIVRRIKCFQCSAFEIQMNDESVENIFSMRFIHHISNSSERGRLLREFHRVASDTVCISLWVDGNFKSFGRSGRNVNEPDPINDNPFGNRGVIMQKIIEPEFMDAGFKIEGKIDLLKYYSMWRIYVLRKLKPEIFTA